VAVHVAWYSPVSIHLIKLERIIYQSSDGANSNTFYDQRTWLYNMNFDVCSIHIHMNFVCLCLMILSVRRDIAMFMWKRHYNPINQLNNGLLTFWIKLSTKCWGQSWEIIDMSGRKVHCHTIKALSHRIQHYVAPYSTRSCERTFRLVHHLLHHSRL